MRRHCCILSRPGQGACRGRGPRWATAAAHPLASHWRGRVPRCLPRRASQCAHRHHGRRLCVPHDEPVRSTPHDGVLPCHVALPRGPPTGIASALGCPHRRPHRGDGRARAGATRAGAPPRGGCRCLGQTSSTFRAVTVGRGARACPVSVAGSPAPRAPPEGGDQLYVPRLGQRCQHQEPFHPRKPFAETLARTTAKGEIGIAGGASVRWGRPPGGRRTPPDGEKSVGRDASGTG